MIGWLILGVIALFVIFNIEINSINPGELILDALRAMKDFIKENYLKIVIGFLIIAVLIALITNGLWWVPLGILLLGGAIYIIGAILGWIADLFSSSTPPESEVRVLYDSKLIGLENSLKNTLRTIKEEWAKLKEEVRNTLAKDREELKAEVREELNLTKREVKDELEAYINQRLEELQKRESEIARQEEELIALKNDLERTLRNLEYRILRFEKKEEQLTALLEEAKELAGIGEDYRTLLNVYRELTDDLARLKKKEARDIDELRTEIIKLHSRLSRMEEHLLKHRVEHPEESREVDKAVFAEILRNNLGLKENEIKLIEYLLKRGKRHQAGLAKALGVKASTVKSYVDHLENLGIVEVEVQGKKKFVKLNRERLIDLGLLRKETNETEDEEEDF
uniref:Transcription regulator TrmB N-terminal domain-containing protein n=1 Tax=Thermococcus sp. IRI33 TaxID=1197733 RepID=L0B8F5_9EURY|nr:helix-turn-helix domain-containing protein [Thermococcus sp. IRI33]AFZ84252.1 hypothetical protein i33-12 [Thermococcus sp. IRI33]